MVRVEFGENGAVERAEFPLDGLGENGDFLAVVKTDKVRTIHTQEATLEEIFIQVTGRTLV
jgi:fluoroquinolone transport system ATP-binding protein